MATFKPILIAVSLIIILVAVSSAAPKQKQFNLEIPQECKGKTICSVKPKGYDEMQKYIESLLNSTFVAQTMTDRVGEDASHNSDSDNCPYIATEVSPFILQETDDSEAKIVIQNNFLNQQIKMIKCAYHQLINVTSSEQCFTKLGLSTFNMKFSCVESSASRTLLVFDPKTSDIKRTPFSFPCCCTCIVEKKFDSLLNA